MPSLTFQLSDIVLRSDVQLRLDSLIADVAMQVGRRRIAQLKLDRESKDPRSFDAAAIGSQLDQMEISLGRAWWFGWKVVGPTGIEESLPYGTDAAPPADLLEGSTECWLARRSGERRLNEAEIEVAISLSAGRGTARVTAPREDLRGFADSVREVLDDYVVVPPYVSAAYSRPPFRIFIAYGGGHAWEIVRDYLRAEGFEVTAFTEEERASQLTLNVVSDMIRSATVAVIVMTGADPDENGAFRSRQNVVHEAGFAQGALGVEQTIILRENGVVLPTNMDGLTYIPFAQNEIHRTKERVLARVRVLQQNSMGGC